VSEEAATAPKTEAAGRFLIHLPQTDDMTLLVLKAHLLIEEQLISILEDCVRDQDALNDARLSFSQRLQLVKAMKYEEKNLWVWTAIQKLNELRNELAHKIDSSKVESKVNGFLDYLVSVPIYEYAIGHTKDRSIMSRLNSALAFLYGVLLGEYVRK